MKTKLFNIWYAASSSFWFIPVLMGIGAIGISFCAIEIDLKLDSKTISGMAWIYAGGAEGARAVLSAISGSMIGVTGVVFSITIVALSLASAQYGPRLLKNFMRDKGNQIVLGTFIATFTYCLLILRTVRGLDNDTFVPHISVTFGIILALGSLGVLIFFIHHVSISIQVENLISLVGSDLDQRIDQLFPEKIENSGSKDCLMDQSEIDFASEDKMGSVRSTATGYLQAIDYGGLVQLAAEKNLIFRVECRPGVFVIKGDPIVFMHSPENFDKQYTTKINKAFILGTNRTLEQDCQLAVEQLVEISLRALSPGINDPFTAVQCINRLSASLCKLALRRNPFPYHYDQDNQVRLITNNPSFKTLLDQAFDPLRQYGKEHKIVALKLLESLEKFTDRVVREEDLNAIFHHAFQIERACREGITEEIDREAVEQRYQQLTKAIEKKKIHF